MRRGFSPAAVAAFLTTLLVLAVVGWSVGWLAAGADGAGQATSSSATPSPRGSRLSTPAASPSPSASASKDAFGMPNLVGKKFGEARQKALDLRLDVTVRFDEPKNLPAGTVARTLPEQGVLLRPGFPIILYVTGPAPKVNVPVLAGKDCGEGKDGLVEVGLRFDGYPSGDKGHVVKTEPPALTQLTWNDPVKVYCASP